MFYGSQDSISASFLAVIEVSVNALQIDIRNDGPTEVRTIIEKKEIEKATRK